MAADDDFSLEELFGAPPAQQAQAAGNRVLNEPLDVAAKLARNVQLALDRQGEILSHAITEDMDVRRQRMIGENAHHSIKTAVQIDAARMRVQQPDRLREILEKMLEEKRLLDLQRQSTPSD